jgi:Ca2+/H+ antiporter, TMEM165/GDT1 family
MARRYKLKIPVMILCGIAAIFLFGFIVMSLWNAILPDVITNVKPISLWQSMGLLLLAKILFGGIGGWRHKRRWREGMHAKWQAMTPEEREKFKAEWKERCGWRGRMSRQQAPTPDAGSEPVQ